MKLNFKGFIDTTSRDGQASPLLYDTYKYRFSLEEKKQIANALVKLGVRYFEFFSPVVSKEERKNFLSLKKYIKSLTSQKIYLFAHCRCHPLDIQAALGLGFDEINFDYIRFASDGVLADIVHPFWNSSTTRMKSLRSCRGMSTRDMAASWILVIRRAPKSREASSPILPLEIFTRRILF